MLGKAMSVSYTVASIDYARKLNLEDSKKGIIIDSNLIVGETGLDVFKEFKIFQDLNSRCENNTISIVISPYPSDSKTLSNVQFAEISKEVLKRMGLQDHQSITIKHPHDTHDHLHCYVNRINTNGITYKDNFISKKIQTVCDEVAIDFNMTRAKEVEIAQHTVKEPTRIKIKDIYKEVLNDPSTNRKNIFWKLRNKGVEIDFNKSNTGYSVILHGVKFSASEIDKSYSLPNLDKTIASSKTKKDFSHLTTKEQIQVIFAATISEQGITTHNFLDKIAEKGIEVIPTINKQGLIQGHRVAMMGENFKISEIGNKYIQNKLNATIEKEGHKTSQQQSNNTLSTESKMYKIISDVLVDKNTTKENFKTKLETYGIKYSPSKNGKGEVNNFKIEFDSKSFLATDVLLKYTLQNPEKLIARTREIQQNEQKGNERLQIRGEVSQLYHHALKMSFPGQKTFFLELKTSGIEFKTMDKSDYRIDYKNQQFIASEINQGYTLDKLDSLMDSFAKNSYNNDYSSQFSHDMRADSHHDVSNVRSSTNSNYNHQDFNNGGSDFLGNLFSPMSMPHNHNDDEETEEEKRKRKLKRKKDNNNLTR